tara:strand:- start:153 stop:578 length:426 start_codon:yes stop_codon:yes gene_type:complete
MAEKYAKRYHVGLGNVGSYQVSAKPFITSSIHVPVSGASSFELINFPYVTKFVTIKNDGPNSHGATLRVAFSADGLKDENNNYFILSGSESFSADFKVTKVFLMGHEKLNADMSTTASVIAGLTGIEADLLSGSWAGSSGV